MHERAIKPHLGIGVRTGPTTTTTTPTKNKNYVILLFHENHEWLMLGAFRFRSQAELTMELVAIYVVRHGSRPNVHGHQDTFNPVLHPCQSER
ncbi:hypothetical protein OUZ56_004701 [Daphnia magna]|uniref:Uncharacterized protein n=1 Tax=Daphnia magna TaxID=35525 RepID=A0ABQ9YQM5_9CRUS|nr:hypothetical protein OUZ56_004701 [Daphnia magna]